MPIWSKDDTNLYFSANFHKESELEPNDSDIYQINIVSGQISKLTQRYGPDSNPALSFDGSKIAYTGFNDSYQGHQQTELYIMNKNGSNAMCISKDFDRDIANIHWNNNGNGLYFQFDDKGNTKIGHIICQPIAIIFNKIS